MSAIQSADPHIFDRLAQSTPAQLALPPSELSQLPEASIDPFAIATFLRHHNPQPGMSITVWRHSCVCILLEAAQVPHHDETISWLSHNLSQLETLKTVRIYARQSGQNSPAWCEELNLAERAIATSTSSFLLNWLEQGANQSIVPPPTALDGAADSHTATQQTRLLRFYLTEQETALLSLDAIREVVKVPIDSVLPVPDMDECVLGVYNHRGEILWLVNLSQQLGFSETSLQFAKTLTIIVMEHDGVSLGAVVNRVTDIEIHHLQNLRTASADLFPLPLRSFLQGYLLQPTSLVLDARSLISHFASP